MAAALPMLMLLWLLPAKVIWVGWGAATGLSTSFALGDSRSVALPNGYELGFIDGSASIYLRGGGEAVIAEVITIAVQGAVLFGFTERGRFVFDTSDPGATHDFESLQSIAPLRPADEFPGRASNPIDALAWCVLWLLPPFLLARRWWIRG